MGYHRLFRVGLSLPLILMTPLVAAHAQESQPGFSLPPAAPPADPRQQGPELDVFRAPTTPAAPPPVVAPTLTPAVTPTPVQTPVPTPAPAPAQRPAPTRTAPAPDATPRAAPPSATQDAPVPALPPAQSSPAQSPPVQPGAIQPTPQAAPDPAPPRTAPVTADPSLPWPWIIGGGAILLALAAAFLRTRRRPAAMTDDLPAATVATPVAPPRPTPPVAPTPAPVPAPEPQPAAVAAPAAPPASDRPWIAVDMVVTQARHALMGVTIGYDLLLHNHGEQPARDLMVRGVIGNAGAQQQALLDAFFTGQSGLPLHSAVAIAPGDTARLSGELRLSPDQIVPVAMGQRSLLIPIIAFDVAYRWGAQDGDGQDMPDGQGRTARAFIVGQDQEPPADRLAPFRLDQGARHYRRAAARAVAELTPA